MICVKVSASEMTKTFNIKDNLISLLFPRRCPICDEPVRPYGALCCTECAGKVRYISEPACLKCGKALKDETREYCEDCSRHSHYYKKGYPLFEYRSVSESIYRFKYRNRREYAAWYGERMGQVLGDELKRLQPDALIPVPIHASKLRSRGYNQAALIARELSVRIGVPVMENVIVRTRKTEALKDHTPAERNNILRGAFKIASNDVKLKKIVIIDDIYTTGSTIDEVARVCLDAGMQEVNFAALAIGRGV